MVPDFSSDDQKGRIIPFPRKAPADSEDTLDPEEIRKLNEPDTLVDVFPEAWPSPEEIDRKIDEYFKAQRDPALWFDRT